MKNTFAKRLAAATIALAVMATPAIAIAQPARAAAPTPVPYEFRLDDLPFGCQFHDEAVMPKAYADAIDAALEHAGLTYRDVEIDDVYVFESPAFKEKVVEVEFETRGLDYDYLVSAKTLKVLQFRVDD